MSFNGFRYCLEKGSKKHICPNCGQKTYVRYIDTHTNTYIPTQYGRCDRENKCGYHSNPYKDGYASQQRFTKFTERNFSIQKTLPNETNPKTLPNETNPIFFDFETFKKTLQSYETNTFIQNLLYNVPFPFETSDITRAIELYRLGTVYFPGYWNGSVTFPFIDINGNIRAIQVKKFDKNNHTEATTFLHSILEKQYTKNKEPLPGWLEAYEKQDKKVTCLFGEHLLNKYPKNTIALVEAPKTAIYATLYFGFPNNPNNLVWLAVYNKSSFSLDKLRVLQNRLVLVFPDLSKDGKTFEEWQTKAKEYERHLKGTRFYFFDLLESFASENDKIEGLDIADYLIKMDWKQFRDRDLNNGIKEVNKTEKADILELNEAANNDKKEIKQNPLESLFSSFELELIETRDIIKKEAKEVTKWGITELVNFFESIDVPNEPIRLNSFTIITDCNKFISTHLGIIKKNNGNNLYLPHLLRLEQFKNFYQYEYRQS